MTRKANFRRARLAKLSCVICLVVFVGCEQESAKWMAAKALNLQEQGRPKEALKLMGQAAEKVPQDDPIKLMFAKMLAENGEGELGVNQCDMVTNHNERMLQAYAVRSQCNQHLGRFEVALEDYKKSISDHISRSSLELNNLAYYRGLAGVELEKAVEAIQGAIDEKDGMYWGCDLRVPLRIRSLIAAGVISRHLDQQEMVLDELNRVIQRLRVDVADTQGAIKSEVTDMFRNGIQTQVLDGKAIEQERIELEFYSQSLVGLQTVRALILEDLGKHRAADEDRRAISSQGFEFEELAEDLPNVQACLAILEIGSAYLDTRGFVYSRLPWNSDKDSQPLEKTIVSSSYEESLNDINAAVISAFIYYKSTESHLFNSVDISLHQVKLAKANIRRTLAILLYHRMLIHQKGGHDELANCDQAKICELGFEADASLF